MTRFRDMILYLFFLLCGALLVHCQPSPEEIEPLYSALSSDAPDYPNIQPRVPLSTNDPTASPLVDLQVYAPPVVPINGTKCTVELLKYEFGDGSYGVPAVVPYSPPQHSSCGLTGHWAAITLNVTSLYLSHVEIDSVKDVTHYSALFAASSELLMDFSNIISPDFFTPDLRTGPAILILCALAVTLTATFYAPTRRSSEPPVSDLILPISNLSPNQSNYSTVGDDLGGTANVTVRRNAQQAVLEIYASGNSEEEFWYLNTPDEFLPYFPKSAGLIGKGPFREVQALIGGQLAGVVWPHAVIYTGGITPTNWRPLTAYGTYDQPTYFVDVTPSLPLLADGAEHSITLRVLGQGQSPSINSNWFLSGSLHLWLGRINVSGRIVRYEASIAPRTKTTGGAAADNATVRTSVTANRTLIVESVLSGDHGPRVVRFEQHLGYSNEQKYVGDGLVQWGEQLTEGTTTSIVNGKTVLRDAFSFPLSVFSNYSLYDIQFGAYGSAINQTYARVLELPVLTHGKQSILSIQHARGWVGMDDAPGLRHAINGTGATDQQFAFTTDGGETYFRRIAAKNDAWVKDEVWGTLRDEEPPVPREQVFPGGGPGFRRELGLGRRAR
ncbi:peptide N-acetyl-beta-D-glucosaminyl asparaginase amidase A-domain-containing protein [Trametes polyzona]|nr:peptide N-acetyl-beta-D-glucosaminyl asparaginase amidase A-domain-containing protein [Trametes polyzona]